MTRVGAGTLTREEYAIGIEIGEEGGDEVIIRAEIEVEA